jgi:glycerate 2-kinase
MKVVVAPDKFKGSLPAVRVAQAIAGGVRSMWPAAEVDMVPMADGGDGTIDALLAAVGGGVEEIEVTGPLGAPVRAPLAKLSTGAYVVETAKACGLELIDDDAREPLRATSRGVGELMRAVAHEDPGGHVIVAIGGTASNDGGAGVATACGYRLLDAAGVMLPDGGGALERLARIDGAAPPQIAVTALVDVDNPLLGERGAARVFGPQKGASPDDVEVIERGLARLAARLDADLGRAVADRPGAGAGGGLGAGLIGFFDADVTFGAEYVIDAVGLADSVAGADLVITGEGRLDDQSLGGKTPIAVARVAAAAGARCMAVAGEVTVASDLLMRAGIASSVSVIDVVGRERSFGDPATSIRAATEALMAAESR